MIRWAALVSMLALGLACAPKVNDPADVQAIKDLMDGYFKAAYAKDSAALQAVLTEKTVLLEPHMAPLVGKDAIGKMHDAFLAGFDVDAKGPAIDVRVAGDLAVAYGRYEETITPKDATLAAERASGHWMAVLERQADRSWKWGWVTANSDQPLPGTTADGSDERAVAQLERDWLAAGMKADHAELERVLAAEWSGNGDGEVMTRAQYLAVVKSGAYKVESATLHDLSVHVFGDAAVATMRVVAKATFQGNPVPAPWRSVDFFVKRGGRWQCVNSQNTTIQP